MTYDGLGKSRVESARHRLLELNPRLQIEMVAENATEQNVSELVSQADVVVDSDDKPPKVIVDRVVKALKEALGKEALGLISRL